MKQWERIDAGNDITRAGYRSVVHKKFRMNSGRIITADITAYDGSRAAAVVALTPDNRVIIARQYRCGPEMIMNEIPGGGVDAGEDPKEAALREMREEVGYDAGSVEFLGTAHANAWDNIEHYYYLARDCQKIASSNPEIDEEIEVSTMTITEFLTSARSGKMTDAAAVLMAYDKLVDIKGEYDKTSN